MLTATTTKTEPNREPAVAREGYLASEPHALPPAPEMERAYLERDSSYNGIFYLGVRTTGIFCLPSCPARNPLPANVEYFATPGEAVFSGYRPCRRCRPLDAGALLPDWAAELVAQVEADPTLRLRDADLRARGLEPATVRRTFVRHLGLTFHSYARGRRLQTAFRAIKEGAELDDVVLEHGFESYSGFRDAFGRTFGQAPARSRGSDCVVAGWVESPLGPLVVAATSKGVCLLEFSDRRMLTAQVAALRQRFGLPIVPGDNDHLARLRSELGEYFEGERRVFTVSLVAPGTTFQERVWDALRRIPYGETRSYQALAESIDAPGASRAVGRANGLNRIAIVIPCHRVVQKDGTLGGYGGGAWRKARLLEIEGVHLPFARA